MSTVDEDILQDFLVEAKESIEKLEELFVELEEDRGNIEILRELFRTMHSLKGAAGFFGFKTLEGIAHFSEDILSKLRDGEIEVTEEIIDMLLRATDHIKYIIATIEEKKTEPVDDNILEFLVELSNFTEKIKKGIVPKGESEKKKEKKEEVKEEAKAEGTEEKKEEKKEGEEGSKEEASKKEAKEEVPRPEVKESPKEEKKAPAEKTSSKAVPTPHVTLTETHIKVDVRLLDQLMNLAGELVLARNRVVQISQKIQDPDLLRSVQTLSLVTTDLQEAIMKTRMQPIGIVFNKFPRIVRDLARALNKKVKLFLEGTETELDRSIIESIKDPLTHLVRNAIDHGIEPPDIRVQVGKPPEGKLVLRAYQEGGQVIIEIEDDGKGIDIEKIRKKAIEKGFLTPEQAQAASEKELLALIFKPGFSTADKVTQVSGRGVGMDVVKTNIEKLGGSIEINTVLGKGTTVRIKIPLTLAIIPALIVTSGSYRYAIPQVNLKELVSIDPTKEILNIGDTEFYRLRGEIIPVLRLSKILNLENGEEGESKNLVILTTGERYIGLLVDKIFDSEEIVVKPLGKWFKNIPIYSGATIMGDGKLALILDVVGLSKYIGLKVEDIDRAMEEEKLRKPSAEETQFILLFNVGEETLALPLALIARLDKISAQDIQFVGGKEVIIYKGKVIPVVRLENYLPLQGLPPQDYYSVLFFTEKEKTCAILCSEIVDVIETTLEVEEGLYNHEAILGHRIIKDRTVLFIDIYKVIEMYDPEWFLTPTKELEVPLRILLAEDSPFYRNMIANYLVAAGYEVETAEHGLMALEKLKTEGHFDLLITDLEMPEMDGFELIKAVRADESLKDLPILVLTSLRGEDIERKVFELGANAYEVKLEREKVLNRVKELIGERVKEHAA